MKAVLWRRFGNGDALEVGELKKPLPKPDEVLVRVKAYTVNRTDCAMLKSSLWIMRLQTGLFSPNKPILGTDFAGVVETVGENVERFTIGDRVFGFDDTGILSHAEYFSTKAKNAIAKIPENVDFATAAASIEGPHYAENFLNKVNFIDGQSVFIHGGTGGIGSALVQLSKVRGGGVSTSGRPEHLDLLRGIGADQTFDYTKEDFWNHNQQYDYVFDAVGKATLGKFRSFLKPKGTYISSELGAGAQNLFLALVTPILGGRKVRFPIPLKRQASLDMIAKLLAEGNYNPIIDRSYQLEQTPEAFEYVLQGQKVGNVVIRLE